MFRDHFFRFWSDFGGAEIKKTLETEKNGPKSKNIGKIRPEGSPHDFFGGGAAEKVDPAEALKLANS